MQLNCRTVEPVPLCSFVLCQNAQYSPVRLAEIYQRLHSGYLKHSVTFSCETRTDLDTPKDWKVTLGLFHKAGEHGPFIDS